MNNYINKCIHINIYIRIEANINIQVHILYILINSFIHILQIDSDIQIA